MSPRVVAALMALCAVFVLSGATADAVPAGRVLVFSDDFSGPAGAFRSVGRWTVATGGGGWGNGELQCYTGSRENSATNGKGQLEIIARRTPSHLCADGHRNSFTSARLTTRQKFTVTHGRLEVRAKLPSGTGAWPAFWALGSNDSQVGWPRCGEIDVMEYTGSRPTITTSAAHLAGYGGAPWYSTRPAKRSTTLSSQFHVYAVEWTGTALTFYRDKVVTGTISRAEVVKHGVWPFDKPFYLILNLAMGGTYAGPVPAGLSAPQRFVVDYVRAYH